jgi:hypothetical protein
MFSSQSRWHNAGFVRKKWRGLPAAKAQNCSMFLCQSNLCLGNHFLAGPEARL